MLSFDLIIFCPENNLLSPNFNDSPRNSFAFNIKQLLRKRFSLVELLRLITFIIPKFFPSLD